MRRLVLVHLVCGLGLAVTSTVRAQTPTPAPAQTPAQSRRSRTATPPAPGQPAEQPAAAPAADAETPVRSLFDEEPRQFEISGRLSSVDGDPARFQRYQDLRDGILLDRVRYTREGTDGAWVFTGAADNVGWRDQRFAGAYERAGKLSITGLWDQIPQFYSVDTRTPYTMPDSPLGLDDATQQTIQNGQAGSTPLNLYVPLATQFDLRERRDIGRFDVKFAATKQLDLTAAFTTQKHSGELPWGASFGFSNDVEVALPYRSRANDFTVGAEWNNQRNMLRVAYAGSWFDNQDDTLVWDSPLRLTDQTSGGTNPGRGRMALWPTNSANTVSVGGYTKLAQADAAHRLPLVRRLEQRFERCCRSRSTRAGLPRPGPAARHHRRVGERRVDEPEPGVARRRGLAVLRAGAPLRLRQPDAAHRDPAVHQLRHVGEGVADRRAGKLRALAHELRRRRDVHRPAAGRPHRRLLAQRRQLRLPHLRRIGRGRPAVLGGRDRLAVAHLPRHLGAVEQDRDRARRGAAHGHRRAAGAASLRHRQPGPRQVHRPGGHRAERLLDLQRLGGPGQGRLRRELLRPAGVDVQDDVRSPPTTASPTASAAARPTTSSATQASRPSRSASPGQRPSTTRTATGRRTRRSASTTSRSTRPRRGSAATPKPGSPTTAATRAATICTASCPAAPCRSRRSFPKCSTSCSSSTSTCGTG